jgi:hypothetical protein
MGALRSFDTSGAIYATTQHTHPRRLEWSAARFVTTLTFSWQFTSDPVVSWTETTEFNLISHASVLFWVVIVYHFRVLGDCSVMDQLMWWSPSVVRYSDCGRWMGRLMSGVTKSRKRPATRSLSAFRLYHNLFAIFKKKSSPRSCLTDEHLINCLHLCLNYEPRFSSVIARYAVWCINFLVRRFMKNTFSWW